jgi:dipeptidyl aminopeptidase/acylaminoacyl peptidase
VSSTNDVVLLDRVTTWGFERRGTLARTSLGGGSPRDELDDVSAADFGPDGSLAVVRRVDNRIRIDYPVGAARLVIDDALTWIGDLRVSPDGRRLAYLRHAAIGDDRGQVAVLDEDGRETLLTPELASVRGLAWAPAGDAILFTAGDGGPRALRSVTLGRDERVLLAAPAQLTLADAASDGRLLIVTEQAEVRTIGGTARGTRDLSWLDFTFPAGLSEDGELLVVNEGSSAPQLGYATYLRRLDGTGPVVRLASGFGGGVSPDKKWMLGGTEDRTRLELVALGPGESRRLVDGDLGRLVTGAWLPDGSGVVVFAARAGQDMRAYAVDVGSARARLIRGTVDWVAGGFVSRDGGRAVMRDGKTAAPILVALDSGESTPVTGAQSGDNFFWFGADRRTLYATAMGAAPLQVDAIDLQTGARRPFRTLMPDEPSGVVAITQLVMTPDASAFAYSYYRNLSTLYVVEGAL